MGFRLPKGPRITAFSFTIVAVLVFIASLAFFSAIPPLSRMAFAKWSHIPLWMLPSQPVGAATAILLALVAITLIARKLNFVETSNPKMAYPIPMATAGLLSDDAKERWFGYPPASRSAASQKQA